MNINNEDLESYERFLMVNSSHPIVPSQAEMDAFLPPPDDDDIACPQCGDTNENNKRYDKAGLAVCIHCNSAFEPGLIGQWLKPGKRNYPTDRAPTGPRPQAGRPAKLQDARRVTIWLESWQIDRLEKLGDKSEFIRNLVTQHFEKQSSRLTPGPAGIRQPAG